jgi:hypothetical protein
MRKLLLLSAFLAVLVPVAVAGGKTYVGPCTAQQKAAYKPHRMVVTCADAGFVLRHLKWSSWGARSAHGRGQAYINTCKPNCASGKFKPYAVKVKLDKRIACKGKHALQFSRVTYTYTGKRPSGVNKSASFTRVCGR